MKQYSDQRTIWAVFGEDAAAYLAEQISTHLPWPEQVRYAFLLSANGRIQSDMFVWGYSDAYYLLELPTANAEKCLATLRKNALNHHVDIRAMEALSVGTSALPPVIQNAWIVEDVRDPAMGYRLMCEKPVADDLEYTKRRLDLGLPEAADLPSAEALPIEYGLEALAIDFDKGCFIGQEVCTRMHRQAQGKFSVVAVLYDGALDSGAEITLEGNKIGQVISVYPEHHVPLAFARVRKETMGSVGAWTSLQAAVFREILPQRWRDVEKNNT